jgi:hypothetical protein
LLCNLFPVAQVTGFFLAFPMPLGTLQARLSCALMMRFLSVHRLPSANSIIIRAVFFSKPL